MSPRSRRNLLVAVAALLVTAASGYALVQSAPHAVVTSSASDADRVTLYQNGLAFVALTRPLETQSGETVLSFQLPTSAIFETLQVTGDGVKVEQVRSDFTQATSVRPGDQVVVHVDDGVHEGTVVSVENTRAALSTARGITLVDLAAASAVEILGRSVAADDAGSATVLVTVDAPAGTRDVDVTYLDRASGWTPSYRMDAATGALTFFATFTASQAWRNVQLELVSGTPNVVVPPMEPKPVPYALERAVASDMAGGFGASEPLGDLHRYTYGAPVSAARGEQVRLPVISGEVDIVRRHHDVEAWPSMTRTDIPVFERLDIMNTLTEPLPAGIVRLYREGAWIGEDRMPDVPVGGRANVTLSTGLDIEATLIPEAHHATPNSESWTYALVLKNLKSGAAAADVDVRATFNVPSWRTVLRDAEPAPSEREANMLVWNAVIPPGGSATFRVSYETMQEDVRYIAEG